MPCRMYEDDDEDDYYMYVNTPEPVIVVDQNVEEPFVDVGHENVDDLIVEGAG